MEVPVNAAANPKHQGRPQDKSRDASQVLEPDGHEAVRSNALHNPVSSTSVELYRWCSGTFPRYYLYRIASTELVLHVTSVYQVSRLVFVRTPWILRCLRRSGRWSSVQA